MGVVNMIMTVIMNMMMMMREYEGANHYTIPPVNQWTSEPGLINIPLHRDILVDSYLFHGNVSTG